MKENFIELGQDQKYPKCLKLTKQLLDGKSPLKKLKKRQNLCSIVPMVLSNFVHYLLEGRWAQSGQSLSFHYF